MRVCTHSESDVVASQKCRPIDRGGSRLDGLSKNAVPEHEQTRLANVAPVGIGSFARQPEGSVGVIRQSTVFHAIKRVRQRAVAPRVVCNKLLAWLLRPALIVIVAPVNDVKLHAVTALKVGNWRDGERMLYIEKRLWVRRQ